MERTAWTHLHISFIDDDNCSLGNVLFEPQICEYVFINIIIKNSRIQIVESAELFWTKFMKYCTQKI